MKIKNKCKGQNINIVKLSKIGLIQWVVSLFVQIRQKFIVIQQSINYKSEDPNILFINHFLTFLIFISMDSPQPENGSRTFVQTDITNQTFQEGPNNRVKKFKPGSTAQSNLFQILTSNQGETQEKHYTKIEFFGCNYLIAEVIIIDADSDLKKKIMAVFDSSNGNQSEKPHQKKLEQYIPFSQSVKGAQRFFGAGDSCYFQVLADIKNAEQLVKHSKYLSRIGEINIYMPSRDKLEQAMQFSRLKSKFPNKIGRIWRNFEEYSDQLKPYVQSYQQFKMNYRGQTVFDNFKMSRNLHPAYSLVDSDLSKLSNHKLNLLRCIKLLEHKLSYQPDQIDAQIYSNKAKLPKIQKSERQRMSQVQMMSKKFQDYLNSLRGGDNETSLDNKKEVIEVYQSIKRQHGYLTNGKQSQQNIVKIICLYKCDSIYHKALNSILRVSKRLSDFNVVCVPFAQTFHTIQKVYHKKLSENGWIRKQKTLWRAVRLQDIKKLMNNKGKYCEFYGFSSFSHSFQEAKKFIPKYCSDGYVMIKLVIPQYEYKLKQNDPRLSKDYGFIDLKSQIIDPNPQLFVKTMKKLSISQPDNDKMFRNEPEKQVLVNCLNTFKNDGMYLKEQPEKISIQICQFTYTTTHQIEEEQLLLESQIEQKKKWSGNKDGLQAKKKEKDYVRQVLEHYTVFNKKFSDANNLGDVFYHLGDYDRAAYYVKRLLDKNNLEPEHVCKFVEYSFKSGSNQGLSYVKQLAKSYQFKDNPTEKQRKVETTIKKSLSDQQDNIELVALLLKKLQVLSINPHKWFQIGQVNFELSRGYIADGKWIQAEKSLEISRSLLKENGYEKLKNAIDQIRVKRQKMAGCVSCFMLIGAFFGNNDESDTRQVQTIIQQNSDLWKVHDLLINVTYHFIECKVRVEAIKLQEESLADEKVEQLPKQTNMIKKDDHMIENKPQKECLVYEKVEQLQRQIKQLPKQTNQIKNDDQNVIKSLRKQLLELIDWKRVLNDEGKLPCQLRLYQIEVNSSMPGSQFPINESLISLLDEEISKLKSTHPESQVVAQLMDIKSSVGQIIIQSEIKSPSSRYLEEQSKIKQSKAIQDLRAKLKSQKMMFDSERFQQQIDQTTKNKQESIEILAKIHGQTIEIIQKRSNFITFLSDTNQIQKSIQQSFTIIKSSFGDKHSLGAEAYFNLGKSYHLMGEQKKGFQALAIAEEILKRAKVKEKKEEYEQLFQVSETRLKIEMMRAKIYLIQNERDMKTKALKSLNLVQNILKTSKCAISLTLLAQVAQEKGNIFGLLKEQKNYVSEFEKAIKRIQNQKGKHSVEIATINCSLAKYALQNKDIQKANQYFMEGFQILSAFPVNHPCMWSSFLVLSVIKKKQIKELKIQIQQKLRKTASSKEEGKSNLVTQTVTETSISQQKSKILQKSEQEAFEISEYCKDLVEKRYPQLSMNKIRVTYNYLKDWEKKLRNPLKEYQDLLQTIKKSQKQEQESIGFDNETLKKIQAQVDKISDEKVNLIVEIKLEVGRIIEQLKNKKQSKVQITPQKNNQLQNQEQEKHYAHKSNTQQTQLPSTQESKLLISDVKQIQVNSQQALTTTNQEHLMKAA